MRGKIIDMDWDYYRLDSLRSDENLTTKINGYIDDFNEYFTHEYPDEHLMFKKYPRYIIEYKLGQLGRDKTTKFLKIVVRGFENE